MVFLHGNVIAGYAIGSNTRTLPNLDTVNDEISPQHLELHGLRPVQAE